MATEDIHHEEEHGESLGAAAPGGLATTKTTTAQQAERVVRSTANETVVRIGLNAGLALAGLNAITWLAGLYSGGAFANGQTIGTFTQPICGVIGAATGALWLGRVALSAGAGHLAAKQAGKVSQGALAGLLVGMVDGGSGLVVTLFGIALFPNYTLSAAFTSAAEPVGVALLVALAEGVALAIFGLLVGTVGGAATSTEPPRTRL